MFSATNFRLSFHEAFRAVICTQVGALIVAEVFSVSQNVISFSRGARFRFRFFKNGSDGSEFVPAFACVSAYAFVNICLCSLAFARTCLRPPFDKVTPPSHCP